MRRLFIAIAGVGAAGAVAIGAAIATASTSTLRVEKNVHVTNNPTAMFRVKAVNAHEAVAVGPAGYPVYTFQGETTHHLICMKTNNAATNCWAFWPPVSVTSAKGISKQSGISGRLGTFRNHGMLQLSLNGQPLYHFTPDLESGNKRQATGDELKTYGSIWHIAKAHAAGARRSAGATGGSTGTGGYSTGTSGSASSGSGSANPYPGW